MNFDMYLEKMQSTSSFEEIVKLVNVQLTEYRKEIGEEKWEEAADGWGLDHIETIEDVRHAATELADDEEARNENDHLDRISGILAAGMYRFHAINNP